MNTPIILAAKLNRVHNIHALMEAKIEVESEDASEMKLVPQVKIDGKNTKTMTALHYAAKKGHVVRFQ